MLDFEPNALSERLAGYGPISEFETDFLLSVQADKVSKQKGDCLIRLGKVSAQVMVLQSGWAVMKSKSKEKGNQILHIYLPGDIIGLSEIGSIYATHEIVMQTDGTVSQTSRNDFYQGLTLHPHLSALLLAIGSLDLAALRYHNACMSSMDGGQNLKFFLLQLRSRLHVTNIGRGDRFQVPFSQVEIGQAIGMTSIYVNKLLRAFKDAGELEIQRPYFRLLERNKWEAETEFQDAFVNLDTSWFPEADQCEGQAQGKASVSRAQRYKRQTATFH
ncbi:Crp/Fnr family transcriptional regulator [Sulfitobacter sp. F26169L]|uniref:Crp/Fnr family transcriptional regulator n=1 Tax=Sulfitobacter sp. F26169L TaxID=2996015 RepID=UPI002260E19B|nr:Crp/Fnr family transcriptional regulator [Sulfitobacter sp. F26169L]MCX7567724.1 Crp/Fnr family transcriptional regulator [Sulfitobacter sp. F26169L]